MNASHLILGLTAACLIAGSLEAQSLELDRLPRAPFHFEGAIRSYPHEANAYNLPRLRTYRVVAADFDGDGDDDLAQVTEIGTLDLIENRDGELVLNERVSLAGPFFGERALRSADFNGDGRVDLAVSHSTLEVFLGDGRGGFMPLPGVPLSANQSRLAAGDFDGDGRDDLAVGYFDAQHVDLFFGNGTRSSFALGFATWTLEAGDLDGDLRPDLVALRGKGSQDHFVHVRLGDGNGGFPTPGVEYGPWTDTLELAVLDADGDGNRDVVTVDLDATPFNERTDLIVLPGDGSGNLGPAIVSRISPLVWIGKDFESRDLDGDGVLDLAVFLQITRQVQPTGIVLCLKGDGTGNFQVLRGANVDIEDFEIVDLDRDGRLEVVGGESQVIPLVEDGGPSGEDLGFQFLAGSHAKLVDLDANGDGLGDLLAVDSAGFRIELRLSDGEGGFGLRGFFPGFQTSGARPVIGNLDGDGSPDVILVGADGVATLLNDGQGNLVAPQQTLLQYCQFCQAWTFGAGDLTGDGLTDLLIGDRRRRDGLLLASLGNGQFVQAPITLPSTPSEMAIGDLTGDGANDVLWVNRERTSELILWPGNGDGTFQTARTVGLPFTLSSYGIVLGDTDGDGDLDVVVSRSYGYAHLKNDGMGSLTLADTFERPGLPFGELQLIDLDGDDDLDLAARTRYPRTALWTFEYRGGRFRRVDPIWEVGADGTFEVFDSLLSDLDGDDRPDLVLSQWEIDPSTPTGRLYFGRPNLRVTGVPIAGERLELDLRMSSARRQPYRLLASLRGTYPGIALPNGERLPLQNDPLLFGLILGGGGGYFESFAGTLNELGSAKAIVDIPAVLPLPAPIGLDFAFVTNDLAGVLRASNAVHVEIR